MRNSYIDSSTTCHGIRVMIGQSFLPAPALRQYVQKYQLWHFTFPASAALPFKPYAPRVEQVLAFCPRGCEWVEHPKSKTIIERPRSYIMGQYVERTNRHIGAADFLVILVNFQPGVLFRLTGIPYNELTNTSVDAEAVFGKDIRRVNERLNSSGNYSEMVSIVEKFLLGLLHSFKKDAHPIDNIANLLMAQPWNYSLMQLAKSSFLCTRQFERKFTERMGITPKLFARIARANKAFRLKYLQPGQNWLSVALECGYHDYQHLVKDFTHFTGSSPAAYLSEDLNSSPERYFGQRDSSLE